MNAKGQNMVEYILVVAVVVVVLIVFLQRRGPMEKNLHKSLGSVDLSINALDKEIGLDGRAPVGLHSK